MDPSITAWPAEVLFSFFSASDPLELASFAQVCKKWSQMSIDNALWRQFCESRWDVLPKEKDFAKNWLIPMREGGIDKERRIDWKRIYLMRDLGEKAEEALLSLLPGEKTLPKWQRDLLNRKKKKKTNAAPASIFSQGWFSVKDLDALSKKVQKSLEKMMEGILDGKSYDNLRQKLLYIANFHMELELQIVSQVNISRLKHVTYGSDFIREFKDSLATYCPDELPRLVAKFSQKFCEMAQKKDVPLEHIAYHLMSCTELYALWHPSADFDNVSYMEPLSRFIRLLVTYLHDKQSTDEWKQAWNIPEDDSPSLTHEIEECVHYMSMSLAQYPKAFDLFMNALQTLPASRTRDMTTICLVHALTEGCVKTLVQDVPSFLEKYFFPYFRVSEDLEFVAVVLFYFRTLFNEFSNALSMSLSDKYASRVLPILLNMFDIPNLNLVLVCQFCVVYCDVGDNEKSFEPYLQPLLDKLYGLLKGENETFRRHAIDAVNSVLMISDEAFVKYGDAAMKQFRQLLAHGDKKTRDTVMEALGRLGAILSLENKASIATDVAELYSQVVEAFKNDSESNEEMVIKLTEFAVSALGKDFAPYLPVILPILFEKAAAITGELLLNGDPMDIGNDEHEDNVEDDDEDEDEAFIPRKYTVRTFEGLLEAKKSAISAFGNLMKGLDSETLQPYLDQIQQQLAAVLEDATVFQEVITITFESYVALLTNHRLSTAEAIKNDTTEVQRAVTLFSGLVDMPHMEVGSLEKIVTDLCQLVTHLFSLVPDLDTSKETVVTLLTGLIIILLTRVEEFPFEEMQELGSQVVDYATNIFSKVQNKEYFLQGPGAALLLMMTNRATADVEKDPLDNWPFLCLISSFLDTFGKDVVKMSGAASLQPLVNFFEDHLDKEGTVVEQVVVYSYGSIAENIPELLPTGEQLQHLVECIENKLTQLKRAAEGSVYDNALMAYTNIIYYHHDKLNNLHEKMVKLSTCFPTALDGDWTEVKNSFRKLQKFFVEKPELFTAEIKNNLKEGLEETIADCQRDEERQATITPMQFFIAKLNQSS